jgi:acyl transferase domain-containing protein
VLISHVDRHAHFLQQDFKVFDAPFFSITPKEAKAMDPTHRILLEATYEGFENAGLSLEQVSGTQTSCYIGTFTADFPNLQARDNEGPSIYRESCPTPHQKLRRQFQVGVS